MRIDTRAIANTALAIFPSREGFGWMVFDGPLSPVFWDLCSLAKEPGTSEEKNARCMERVESLVAEYHPAAIVLEAFEGPKTRRHKRIRQLCRSIASLAAMNRTPLRIVSRDEITSCFGTTRPKTRYAVATLVAKYLREIGHRLPPKRRAWDTEFPDMALFNAAVLLVVYYANPLEPL